MGSIEYRTSFLITAFFRFIEAVTGFAMIIIFVQINSGLGGWSGVQVLMISLTYTLSTSLAAFFLFPGLKQFANGLNTGNIDNYLIKPLNIQFYASFSQWDWTQIFKILGAVGALTYLVLNRVDNLNIFSLSSYIFLIFVSSTIMYGIVFSTISLVLHTGRLKNVTYLAQLLIEPGKWPISIYPGIVGIFFTLVIPVWFAATVPVGVLTESYGKDAFILAIFAALVILFVSNKILTTGIKKYSSASS